VKINSRFAAMTFAFLALVAATAINRKRTTEQDRRWMALQRLRFRPETPGPATFLALDSFATGGGWSGHASTDSVAGWSPPMEPGSGRPTGL